MNEVNSETTNFDESLYGRFESAWRRQAPRPIEDCLPPDDDPRYLSTLEELIKVDLDYQWRPAPGTTDVDANTSDEATAGHGRKVEDYIVRFPVIQQPDILLSLLHEEFLVRDLWDQTPSMEEYRERFPDLDMPPWTADESLGETGIGETRRLAPATGHALAHLGAAEDRLPIDLGNYVLLEEIGRGGMGLVYRAEQKGADRVVALKLVRRELLVAQGAESHNSALERFKHEVQATARLDHPDIVSVFEVGDMDRDPYFSMQYVEGQNLGEMVRDGPIESRQAATYMEAVAGAVAYAHGEGILHRDLKPPNILVETKTDKPLVADFGLAKLQENADELTKSSDFMGSPPYMSPEQATNPSRIGEQADVYSLGATLYHLLTGRPPFVATTITEMIEKIRHETPVAPRRRNILVDPDLETICLKCLEKSVSHRYATAAILADELRRYLDHEPIRARPVGPVGRTWRWSQRNPVTATSLALAVVGLLAALIAATVGYVRTSASLTVATEAMEESDESFRLARSAVDRLYTQVAEDDLFDQPGMDPLRRKLLEEAAEFYEQFLEQRKDDPTVRDELAGAHFRVGCIREHLGDYATALESLEQARDTQEKLHSDRPQDFQRLVALGDTTNRIGRVRTEQGDLAGALSAYKRSREIRQLLVEQAPDVVDHQRALANTLMNEGVKEKDLGVVQFNVPLDEWNDEAARECRRRFDDARELLLEAKTIREKLLAADTDSFAVRCDQAKGLFNLANLEICAGELAESSDDAPLARGCFDLAEKYYLAAIEEFEGLLEAKYNLLESRSQLAICHRRLADFRVGMGDTNGAREPYDQACDQLRSLVESNPDVPRYQGELAGVLIERSKLARPQQAVQELTEAQDLLKPLVAAPRYRASLIATLKKMAQHLQTLSEADPSNSEWQTKLSETRERLQALGMSVSDDRKEE